MTRKIGVLISLDLDTGDLEVKCPDDPVAAMGLIEMGKIKLITRYQKESDEAEEAKSKKIQLIHPHGIMKPPIKG